ncbi:MAG: hypothetical protein ACRDJI_00845 [Actinomycetota bacterium]
MTGLVAQHPELGGVAWDYVQYPVGLAGLGHDVYYLEDSGQWPYRSDGGESGNDWIASDCRANINHLHGVMSRFGLGDKWAYRFPATGEWFGMADVKREEVLRSADLILNVSGMLERPVEYGGRSPLVYIDSDPVFTQVRLAARLEELGLTPEEEIEEAKFKRRVALHDVHFSFGERFSAAVPPTEYQWLPTRQPVVLSEWRTSRVPRDAFTTVMSWTSYTPLRYAGRTYAQKDVEFRRFLGLPEKCPSATLEVALNSTHHANWERPSDAGSARDEGEERPETLMKRFGWRVVDASAACSDLDSYREFVRSSKAEWAVAKSGYVLGRPGWFSCRSACYLAAGRPVVVQDTGFSEAIPVGEGILTFSTLEEAADAIEDVQAHYRVHAAGAGDIAEAYFDSDQVLGRLLEQSFASSRPATVGGRRGDGDS